MSRNKKLLIALIVVLSVGIVATTLGLTSAYWVGASGTSEVAPQTDTTDWNYWIKYFIYEPITDTDGSVYAYKVVGFSGAVYENVIVPRKVYGAIQVKDGDTIKTQTISEDHPVAVTLLGNTTFADTTEKSVPVTITIPTTVDVEYGTFIGMSNLTTIKIVEVDNLGGATVNNVDIGGQYALLGCNSIQKIIVSGDVTVNGYAVSSDGKLNSNTAVLDGLKAYLAAPNVEFEVQ